MPPTTGTGLDPMLAVQLKDAIGASSQSVAAGRAVESEREDALFVDPLAKYFAGARDGLSTPAILPAYVAVRTHFIDMELMDALTARHAAAPSNAALPKQVRRCPVAHLKLALGRSCHGCSW